MKYIFYASFLCLSIFLVGCEAEESVVKESQDVEMRHLSFEEFKAIPAAYNAARKYLKPDKLQSMQRTLVYDPVHDFYVDTDQILEVSRDGFSSITLPVYRSEKKDYDENLYLVRTPDDKYTTFLVRYNLTDEDRKNYLAGGEIEGLPGKTIIYDFNQNTVNCEPEIYSHCYYNAITVQSPIQINNGDLDDHWPAPDTTVIYVLDHCDYTVLECYESLIEAYPFVPGTAGGAGGTHPAGTSSPRPINSGFVLQSGVHPLLTPIISPPDEDPCETLKAIGDIEKIDMNNDVEWMKEKLDNPTASPKKEFGVSVEKIPLPEGGYTYICERHEGADGALEVVFSTTPRFIGGGHLHPKESVPIPSFGDIYILNDFYVEAWESRKPEVFNMVVCKDYVNNTHPIYVIRVDNPGALQLALNNKLAGINGADDKAKIKKVLDLESKAYSKPNVNIERTFLGAYAAYGISLYKATDNSLTHWTKLSLNPANPLEIIETPCN